MFKYGIISGPYFPVIGLNKGKYGPEKTPYLNTFPVGTFWNILKIVKNIYAFFSDISTEYDGAHLVGTMSPEYLTIKTFCPILHHLYNLKNVESTHGGVNPATLLKVHSPIVVFCFFKIVQKVTNRAKHHYDPAVNWACTINSYFWQTNSLTSN